MRNETEHDELVMSLVEYALEHSPESRGLFLAQLDSTHPDVAAEVQERVAWELQMGSFLKSPVL